MPSRSLDDLRPEIRDAAKEWLLQCQSAGLDILITCTLRSLQEQADLYASGRTKPGHILTKAQAGQSAHNYGLALDFVPLTQGKPNWIAPGPDWEKAVAIAEKLGLESASHWTSFREWPHLQVFNWKDLITESHAA